MSPHFFVCLHSCGCIKGWMRCFCSVQCTVDWLKQLTTHSCRSSRLTVWVGTRVVCSFLSHTLPTTQRKRLTPSEFSAILWGHCMAGHIRSRASAVRQCDPYVPYTTRHPLPLNRRSMCQILKLVSIVFKRTPPRIPSLPFISSVARSLA